MLRFRKKRVLDAGVLLPRLLPSAVAAGRGSAVAAAAAAAIAVAE